MSFTLEPIGVLRCPERSEFLTPVQPEGFQDRSVVELEPDRHLDIALEGLAGFSRIWLVWWFDRKSGWKPKILPPRGRPGRQGVFATRSPHRPNPIGITPVRLLEVHERRLVVSEHDLLDGTPILDIKPYIPRFDSFPYEAVGWFAQVERQFPVYHLELAPQAERQVAWLKEHEPGLWERAELLLTQDPFPHRTRRIVPYEDGFRLGCGDWRVYYTVQDRAVQVNRIASRFPEDDVPP